MQFKQQHYRSGEALTHGDYTFQDPFFKIFANQPPVFIISFHLPEIPPLPLG